MSTQQLENQQRLLSKGFIGEGNPYGTDVFEESFRREVPDLRVKPPLISELKVFHPQETSPLGSGSDTCRATYHHLGCTILLSKRYSRNVDYSKYRNIIGFTEFPIELLVVTEEQNDLERCSEYLKGLGYNEVKQGGKE